MCSTPRRRPRRSAQSHRGVALADSLLRKDVGEARPFPGAAVEKAFAWAPAHLVADAYRAFKPMPYDAPAYDLAAVA
jgi:hypothetical protein